MSHPAAGFGAIHQGGRGHSQRGRTNENAAEDILVVQVRRLGKVFRDVSELAARRALIATWQRAYPAGPHGRAAATMATPSLRREIS